jgi:hypothetical protein
MAPTNVSNVGKDESYTISNNLVKTSVVGGGDYEHMIWDYDVDHLYIRKWYGAELYHVESRPTECEYRKIVLLKHVRTTYGPIAWFIPGKCLNRKNYSVKGTKYNYNSYKLGDQIYYSFGEDKLYSSVALPEEVLYSIKTKVDVSISNGKTPLLSDVERVVSTLLGEEYVQKQKSLIAALLFNVLCTNNVELLKLNGYSRSESETGTYQVGNSEVFREEPKPVLRKVKLPDCEFEFAPCVAPAQDRENELVAIKERVLKVRNKTQPNSTMLNWMKQFCALLVPDDSMHTLIPTSVEHVKTRLKNNNQKQKFEKSQNFIDQASNYVSSFIRGNHIMK